MTIKLTKKSHAMLWGFGLVFLAIILWTLQVRFLGLFIEHSMLVTNIVGLTFALCYKSKYKTKDMDDLVYVMGNAIMGTTVMNVHILYKLIKFEVVDESQ